MPASVVMATTPLHSTVVYEQDDEGRWIAQVPEVQGAVSQGRTQEEARAMVVDALALALEARRESFLAEHSGLTTEMLSLAS